MTAEEILMRAKSDPHNLPENWTVFPLLHGKVIMGIFGWLLGIIMGFGLLALIVPIVIPINYLHGVAQAIFTTVLLGILLFVGVGSIWMMVSDIRRLSNASQHLLVITPEDFVKQEGNKIIHVPLINIRHITARGTPQPNRNASHESNREEVPNAGENTLSFLMGRGTTQSGIRQRRKRMRTPSSLAFLDTRDDNHVIVVNDTTYGDPYMIGAMLKEYTTSVQQIIL